MGYPKYVSVVALPSLEQGVGGIDQGRDRSHRVPLQTAAENPE